MNRARTTLALTLGAALLCGALARAQSIVGNVSTTFGVPVSGVVVTGTRSSPFQQVTDTTDMAGNYSLSVGLPGLNGTYSVVPGKSGYIFTPTSTNVFMHGLDETVNFTTPATAPSVLTAPALNVTPTSATLQGVTDPDGSATAVHYEYGLTTGYGVVSSATNVGSGIANVAVDIAVAGLLNGTNYHFHIVASNAFGVTPGGDRNFSTPSGVPSATTLDPTVTTTLAMTLNGEVDPNGATATAGFEWGQTTNYGNATAGQNFGSGASNTAFSQTVTGMVFGTDYHCRAAAKTIFGTNYGADVLFTPVFSALIAGFSGTDLGSAAWGDYDGDGLLDILLTGINDTTNICELWRNTGSGFLNVGTGLPGVKNSSVAWGDYDNDERLDILLTGTSGPVPIAQVWRNTGVGFTKINASLPGVYLSSAAWGDFDNDGRPDILLTGFDVNMIPLSQVWRNTSSGFSNINAGLPGVEVGSGAWGDYDNDGRLDILLTGRDVNFNPIAQVWRNTGTGFTNINAGLPGVRVGSGAWGDFDNDGKLDILLTGNGPTGQPMAQVWRNTGSGFANINAGLAGVKFGSGAWGDYDNDGRLDVLLTGGDANGRPIAQVWRNTDSGFVNINTGLPGVIGSSTWGDFDNDGRLDILLAGVDKDGNFTTQVLKNNTQRSNGVPFPPTGMAVSPSGTTVTLSWYPANDSQTPAAGLTYNVRVGTTPGGSEVISPMSAANGFRRLPKMGNAQLGLSAAVSSIQLGQTYYWSVQAVDTAFAGSAFAPEQSFTLNTTLTPPNGIPVPGDLNGDGLVDQAEFAAVVTGLNGNGIVSQSELDLVLSNYWPYSPWLYMTNVAGLGGTNVTFALTNSLAGAFSVEFTTNFADWQILGPATPRYEFDDTNAPAAAPQRYYRLRWP